MASPLNIPLPAESAACGRKTITPEPYVPNLKTLREKIDQDATLLSSLDPESDTYRRLQNRITEQTTQLLDYENILEQRRQQAAVIAAQQARAEEQSSAVGCGLVLAVLGVLAIVVGWGTWWIAAGIVLLFVAIGTTTRHPRPGARGKEHPARPGRCP